jgi:hypothetical protein
MTKRPTFEQAKRKYVHRYTMEHTPLWAMRQRQDGTFYAPQYRSDQEWYDNTIFPGEETFVPRNGSVSMGQTWPLGQSLQKACRTP